MDLDILKIASDTRNMKKLENFTHSALKKNSMCGDLIIVELILKNSKINSMKYETESCILCEASASLLSKKIKNLPKEFSKVKLIIIFNN